MAKAAELDTELVNGLKAAKSKRAYFALVLKGSNDGALIVSKTKVPPAAITEAKKQSGGSAVLKGFCAYEEGTYVFETAKQAPATAAQAVKVIAKRDAGLAVKAEFRISTDPELLVDEGDAPATAPPKAPPGPPQADGALVIKRLNAMTADIKTALAGPNKALVQALYLAISGQIKSKAFVDAGKRLDELQKLLKPATSSSPQADGVKLAKRLNAMTADIKAALAGPNKARVQSLYVAASGLIKSKDFVQAGKALDELEALVKPVQPASGAAPPNDDAAQQAEWERRVTEMEPNILAAQRNRPADAKWMTMFMTAQDLGGDGDFVKSFAILDRLDALLNAPRKATESGSLETAAARWDAARAATVAKLKDEIKLVAAIEHPDAAKAELQLKAVMAQLNGEMTTRQQATEMKRYLKEDDVVADVSELAFDLKTPLLKVLGEITPQLSA